jgi:hypothetical protein
MIQARFGNFVTDGEGGIIFLTYDGDPYGVAIADEDIEAQEIASALNNAISSDDNEISAVKLLSSCCENNSGISL